MEQIERVMTTMTGSLKITDEVLHTMNDNSVYKATYSVASWGDAVAFYGDGSNETFANVTDALARMAAKGKVQMQEMNRLTEAGIPAMQIYADATGQSVEEVAAQMQAGALDA